ncbi:MAG: hypothetical protein ACM3MG_03700 [Bacillota bacterium]
MNKFVVTFLSILAFSPWSHAASSTLATATSLSKETRLQDGANCFNTSLYTLGFTQLKIYAHQSEFDYYVKFHCREVSFNINKLTSDSLLSYSDNNNQTIHAAVALDTKNIIEKNSLYGSKHKQIYGDNAPGKYLIHPIADSIFFKNLISNKNDGTGHAYICQSKELVQKVTKQFLKDEGTRNISQFLTYLASLTEIKDRKALEKKLNKNLLEKYRSLKIKEYLGYTSGNNQLDSFKLGLMESAAYQWNLLNCTEAYDKYEECYAPEVQASIDALEDLYPSIFAYRDYVKSQSR